MRPNLSSAPTIRRFFSLGLRGLLASSWILLISCGSSEDSAKTDTKVTATYASLWTNLFSSSCVGCHGPGKDQGTINGPDMRTQDSFFAQVVGKKTSDYPDWASVQKKADCDGKYLIQAGNAADSLVVGVLDADNAPCTLVDHSQSPQLVKYTADTLAALKEWINAGATK